MATANIPTSTPNPGWIAKQTAITPNIAAAVNKIRISGVSHVS